MPLCYCCLAGNARLEMPTVSVVHSEGCPPCAEVITDHPFNNVTENIFTKIGANLHRRPDHPICIIKEAIYSFFDERRPGVFSKLDDLHPVVSAYAVRALILHRPARLGWHLQQACRVEQESDASVTGHYSASYSRLSYGKLG